MWMWMWMGMGMEMGMGMGMGMGMSMGMGMGMGMQTSARGGLPPGHSPVGGGAVRHPGPLPAMPGGGGAVGGNWGGAVGGSAGGFAAAGGGVSPPARVPGNRRLVEYACRQVRELLIPHSAYTDSQRLSAAILFYVTVENKVEVRADRRPPTSKTRVALRRPLRTDRSLVGLTAATHARGRAAQCRTQLARFEATNGNDAAAASAAHALASQIETTRHRLHVAYASAPQKEHVCMRAARCS